MLLSCDLCGFENVTAKSTSRQHNTYIKQENCLLYSRNSFLFRAYNYADPSGYTGPPHRHQYSDPNENPYDYVAPRPKTARTSPNQNAVYARPYVGGEKHVRGGSGSGSMDQGRSFMNQIYMDTEQLMRARQQEHAPTSNHSNMGPLRDSGYPDDTR